MREIAVDGALAFSVGLSVVSIACFNFFGISVTKALSGAARATIDACRTLFIWLVALGLGWEKFLGMQVVGFVVLFAGAGPGGGGGLASAGSGAGGGGGRRGSVRCKRGRAGLGYGGAV